MEVTGKSRVVTGGHGSARAINLTVVSEVTGKSRVVTGGHGSARAINLTAVIEVTGKSRVVTGGHGSARAINTCRGAHNHSHGAIEPRLTNALQPKSAKTCADRHQLHAPKSDETHHARVYIPPYRKLRPGTNPP